MMTLYVLYLYKQKLKKNYSLQKLINLVLKSVSYLSILTIMYYFN